MSKKKWVIREGLEWIPMRIIPEIGKEVLLSYRGDIYPAVLKEFDKYGKPVFQARLCVEQVSRYKHTVALAAAHWAYFNPPNDT